MRKSIITFLIILSIILAIVYYRRTTWYNKLSGEESRLTVAHVFDESKVKGTIYYHYLYKVGDDYYYTSSSGSNVNNLESIRPQCFLVSYNQKDPTVHIVLFSYKFDSVVPLGSKLDTLKVDKTKLVKQHTSFWAGTSPTSEKNNQEQIAKYNEIKALNN